MKPWPLSRAVRGPWTPRRDAAAKTTDAITPPPVLGDEPPHSTPRAACTLMPRDQVWVASRWLTVEATRCLRTPGEPSQTIVHTTSGAVLGSRFDYVYVSRDEDEQAAARAEEACHGVG